MKNKFLLLIGVFFTVVSCNPGDFDDMNVDPTKVTEAPTRTLLTYALQQLPYTVWNSPPRYMGTYTAITYNLSTVQFPLYAQYLAEGPYPGASLYNVRNYNWSPFYTGPLYNLQTIINLNNEDSELASPPANGSKNNQVAVARILKAYYFWFLTDIYGDIPYFNALKGNAALQPAYDPQKDIYYDLFKELTEAVAQINETEGLNGDILLNGDMVRWKKFANTTRLFMALRLTTADPAKAQAEFTAALNAGVLEAGENITYQFIGGDPNNWNPWYENYSNDNRNDYAISNTLGDFMIANNDPRIFVYGENLVGQVKPLSYGSGTARNIPGVFSRIGSSLQADDTEVPIFTNAQVQFVKAEGVIKGLTTGDAAQLYNDGIKASWQFWGVYDEAQYNTFITDPEIAYNPATALQNVMTQKWVHQFLNGFEAWTDWRRTGFPALTPAEDDIDSRGIPLRQSYPSTASALNKAGYDAAVARQGSDENYTKVWWDK